MMNIPFVDLSWQHKLIKEKLKNRFAKIFLESSYVNGSEVKEFESHFSTYIGIKHCVAVGNGTDALFFALKSIGVRKGDEVLVVSTTFFATASAIIHAEAVPVFVDINIHTRCMDKTSLEKMITSKTKVIVPVHLYGQPVDMSIIMKLAKKYKLKVVEDACQAHGAKYKGKKVGTFGDIACFSFYPGKNLGAYGDAGAIVCNNDIYANICRQLRDHGSVHKYKHDILGYNSRMDSMQAAVLNEKLTHLDKWNTLRIKAAEMYHKGLSSMSNIEVYKTLPYTVSVYHLYIIRLIGWDRDEFMKYMNQHGIALGIHYPIPLHVQPALRFLKYKKGDFPHTEIFCDSIVSLPIFPGIQDRQVKYVISQIHNYANTHKKN